MGRMADRPACPNCGHQIDLAEIESVEAEMQKFRDQLAQEKDDDEPDDERAGKGPA